MSLKKVLLLVGLVLTFVPPAAFADSLSQQEIHRAAVLCFEEMANDGVSISLETILRSAHSAKSGIKRTRYYRSSAWESTEKAMNSEEYPYYLKTSGGHVCFFNLETSAVQTFYRD